MRHTAKTFGLAVVSVVGSIVLGIASAFTAAFAFGAVGLVVPGTGTPDANIVVNYLQNARDWYMQDTACTDEANCPTDTALQGINYPASFWPLVIFPSWCRSGADGCDKWDVSVGKGAEGLTTDLDAALATAPTPGERDIVIFGYSQGGAVVAKVLNDYGLTDAEKARIEVVTIGGIENPDGGLWQRLAFLRYIPILDVTLGPAMPVDPDIKTVTYGFEYDPVVYAPRYWGNPFAMLNALAAFDNVHGYYLSPNGNGPDDGLPYGYTPATLAPQLVCNVGVNCRTDQYGNEYIMIPATSLPIMNLVLSSTPSALLPIVKPVVDLISPVYKVLADLGYDWSGNPGTSTPLSILPFNPFQNWGKVGVDLVDATGQGIHDFLGDLGVGSTLLAPTTVQGPTSLLAGRSSALSAAAQIDETTSNVTELASVKKSEPPAVVEVTPVAAPVDTSGTNEAQQSADQNDQDQTDTSTKDVTTKTGAAKAVTTKDVTTKDVTTKDVTTKTGAAKAVTKNTATHVVKKDVAKDVRDARDTFKKNVKDSFKKKANGASKKAAAHAGNDAAAHAGNDAAA